MTEYQEMLRRVLREELRPRLPWRREPDYVVKRGSAAENMGGADAPSVLWDEKAEIYRMYYEARDAAGVPAVGYAESKDGKLWALKGTVFTAADSPWADRVERPGTPVVLLDGVYYLYYVGRDPTDGLRKIGLAKGTDGVTFTDVGSPVLVADAFDVGVGEDVHGGAPRYYDGKFWMVYNAWVTYPLMRVFFAVSNDGEAWKKRGELPEADSLRDEFARGSGSFLTPGEGAGKWWQFYDDKRLSHQWDEFRHRIKFASGRSIAELIPHGPLPMQPMPHYTSGLEAIDDPCILRRGDRLQLWFGTGGDSGIGYAEAEITDTLLGANFPEEKPHLPPCKEYFWKDESISAGDASRYIIAVGYTHKTIHFISDTGGTLAIQVWVDETGTWRDYDDVSITANTFTPYVMGGDAIAIRLKFSAAATVSGWIIMER